MFDRFRRIITVGRLTLRITSILLIILSRSPQHYQVVPRAIMMIVSMTTDYRPCPFVFSA
jgi:hypothetical protein